MADALNRRVARKVDGVVTQRFVYTGGLGPAAEVDASGAVLTRFVYGTHVNVPDYFVREGVTYRVVTDHLGSVRLVINAETGEVAQRLEYDAYGQVLENTNPGFQPFGFAGGLLDEATGLERIGARDYDAGSGRWTRKDPIGLAGGANAYMYAGGDPVGNVDPSGEDPMFTYLGQFLANAIPYVRLPDCVSLSASMGLPSQFAELNELFGFSIVLSADRYGNFWYSPLGVSGGKTFKKGAAFSATANWMTNRCVPSELTLANLLSADSYTVGGGDGYGASTTWNTSGRSIGGGFFTPQIGGSWDYNYRGPRLPFSW